MRRVEIVEALKRSIGDEFDDQAAGAFNMNDKDNLTFIARMLQNECDPADDEEVRDIVRSAYKAAPDRELDQLGDGDMGNPMQWLYDHLYDQAKGR